MFEHVLGYDFFLLKDYLGEIYFLPLKKYNFVGPNRDLPLMEKSPLESSAPPTVIDS